jgi:hypothetical protein
MVDQALQRPTRLDRHRPVRGRTVTAATGRTSLTVSRFVKERNWIIQTAL